MTRSLYPSTEARIEDAAILYGPECRNYSTRRSDAIFIHTGEAEMHGYGFTRDLHGPPHFSHIIGRKRADHRLLEGWEHGLIAEHKLTRKHKATPPAKRRLSDQFARPALMRRRARPVPKWLSEEMADLPRAKGPLAFSLSW